MLLIFLSLLLSEKAFALIGHTVQMIDGRRCALRLQTNTLQNVAKYNSADFSPCLAKCMLQFKQVSVDHYRSMSQLERFSLAAVIV